MMALLAAAIAATTLVATASAPASVPYQRIPYFDQSYYVVEAENFTTSGSGPGGGGGGWVARRWGDGNYFCSSLDVVFLSRQAYLQAAAGVEAATATATIEVAHPDTFQVMVRYEMPYHFNVGFRVGIAQGGKSVFSRVYGLRENLKLWPYSSLRSSNESCAGGLQSECVWMYGPEENDVWEGVGSAVRLEKGPATITLTIDADANAASDDSPLANRNVDLVMLFPNRSDIEARMAYGEVNAMDLAGDGLLSQAGEVYMQ